MDDCDMLKGTIITSFAVGVIKGIRKTKEESIGIKILSVADEILKNFNKNKGPKLIVNCTTKKNKCMC